MFSRYDVSLKPKTLLRMYVSRESFRLGKRRLAIGGSNTVFLSIALGLELSTRPIARWYLNTQYIDMHIVR